jgi:hypothetical protein
MSERSIPSIHGEDHAMGGPDPIPGGFAIYAIEVFEVDVPVESGDKRFDWEIPEDIDGGELIKVEGYVNEAPSGTVQIQIAKTDNDGAGSSVDMLTDKITIEAGDLNSRTAATQPLVRDDDEATVAWGDHFRIDVDNDGGAVGMGVVLYFLGTPFSGLRIVGVEGPAGGVNNWTGAYDGGGTYSTGDSASHNGSSYVARVDNPTTEPGVDPGWEDEWQLLSEANVGSAIQVVMVGRDPIDVGIKAFVEVPFDCTIDEVVMLANTAGNLVVDIWKTDYGSFPPVDGDSITAGTPPTIASGVKSSDTSLTGWDTSLVVGDVLAFNVDSCDEITLATITLNVTR